MGFKNYYLQKHGLVDWGAQREYAHIVNQRIADTLAEYVDLTLKGGKHYGDEENETEGGKAQIESFEKDQS
jgi:hypothetical protein